MRTVLAVKFPDMVIADAGSGGPFMHVQGETAAAELSKNISPKAGFKAVYLVTDDVKAYQKDLKDASKKKVADYIAANKKLLNDFMSMTPEERKAVMKESSAMMNQMDPGVMAEVMGSMFEQDPEFITRQSKMGMQAIVSMKPEARQRLIRMSIKANMEAMQSIPPEIMQEFQKEAAAVAAEMLGGMTPQK
jgi:hypothetical protein